MLIPGDLRLVLEDWQLSREAASLAMVSFELHDILAAQIDCIDI